ncbi:RTA1 like protein-domain-containing protein [Mycena crocata]|nr:RTA1 like protein-domain-containing protein [Mycena crocata]
MVQVKCMDPRENENYSFLYCPSFPAAVIFSVLFAVTTVAHIVQAIHYRKSFCWVIIMAGIWETAGLVLRVLSVLNTTSLTYGIPSQLLILLAPLWINAFLYVLMSRFVYFFIPEKKVAGISAQRLSLCFVLLDISAFAMQAIGGSSMNSKVPSDVLRGIHIYMGGIGLQQFFVLGFTALVIRFHYRMLHIDGPTEWKRPLYLMYASLGLITLRIVYRLIEFSSGVYSPLTMHEAPFYCLEALPMVVALSLWNLCHPGRILVGPDSEFPKKVKKSKKSDEQSEKELRLLQSRSPSPPV